MKFGGIQKTTLLDYPGEVAATLFVAGCNFKCPYCHNPELVNKDKRLNYIEWDEIKKYLQKRKNVLGGICITGGEPLLYEEIKGIVDEVHALGLKVKIDTNGSFPERLKKINMDYIAMDIKTSLNKYDMIGYVGRDNIVTKIRNSIEWTIKSEIEYEFRTTVVPGIVEIDDIKDIVSTIKGAKKYVLAKYRPKNTLDPKYEEIDPFPFSTIEEMKKIIENAGIEFEARGY